MRWAVPLILFVIFASIANMRSRWKYLLMPLFLGTLFWLILYRISL